MKLPGEDSLVSHCHLHKDLIPYLTGVSCSYSYLLKNKDAFRLNAGRMHSLR